jgi:Domain of unknown function (DUF4365)
MSGPEDGSPAVTGVVPVIPHMFTDSMEQLQQGVVQAVAATAGCTVEFSERDRYGVDATIIRQIDRSREEISVKAALKSTTRIGPPDPARPQFSYQFHERAHLERLTLPRRTQKMILLLMLTCPEQAGWTQCDHECLMVRHSCYWAYLEGYEIRPGVRSPSVAIRTANLFDSTALTRMMDKLDRGESLRDD